jgi:hypothetical protein
VQDMNTPQIPVPGSTPPARRGASSVLYTLVGFVAGCVAMFGSLFLLNAEAVPGAAECSMSATVMSIDRTIEDGLGRPTPDPTLVSTEEPSGADERLGLRIRRLPATDPGSPGSGAIHVRPRQERAR